MPHAMLSRSIMKTKNIILLGLAVLIFLGFLLPDRRAIPVLGATKSDWNADTFWYEPWGSSGVHKGIDIFSTRGTPVIASTDMMILYKGKIEKGGNVVLGLGPKWRLHYFAHMASIDESAGVFVAKGRQIGTVGDSGNAKDKPPHLHFSIVSTIPLPWLVDRSSQGYKKAFYINPIEYFR